MGLINTLQGIGDAIREKTGTNEPIPLKNMAEVILNLSGGANCKSAVYNEDDTITLIDNNDKEHIIKCVYGDNGLESVTYDGEIIEIAYDEGALIRVADTQIDVSKVPATSGGGAELNIAYGNTEPDDTSKLWIKANEPESIVFSSNFEGVESIEVLSAVLPKPVWSMGYAKVGDKIYLFGGSSDSSNSYYNYDIYIYDIKTNIVSAQASNFGRFVGASCVSVGTDIYIFGGANTYNDTWYNTIYKYDTTTDALTLLETTLPVGRTEMGCVAIGTKIFLLGGYKYSSSYSKDILMFDTEDETITILATKLPTSRCSMGCVSVGTDIYLFGGSYYDSSTGQYKSYQDSIWKFDTQAETITVLDTVLTKGCQKMGCVNIGNKIYLFGGLIANNTNSNTITIFDINTETFETSSVNLSYNSDSMACISDGVDVYLCGGNGSGSSIIKFTASKDLAQNNIEVLTGSHYYFNVVNTDTMKVEIGIDSVLIGNAENQAENCEAYLYQDNAWVQI